MSESDQRSACRGAVVLLFGSALVSRAEAPPVPDPALSERVHAAAAHVCETLGCTTSAGSPRPVVERVADPGHEPGDAGQVLPDGRIRMWNGDAKEPAVGALGLTWVLTTQTADRMPWWWREGRGRTLLGLEPLERRVLEARVPTEGLLPLASLVKAPPERPSEAAVARAEATSVVQYVLEHKGRASLEAIDRRCVEGAPFDRALLEVTGWTPAGLEAAWRASVIWPVARRSVADDWRPWVWIGAVVLLAMGAWLGRWWTRRQLEQWFRVRLAALHRPTPLSRSAERRTSAWRGSDDAPSDERPEPPDLMADADALHDFAVRDADSRPLGGTSFFRGAAEDGPSERGAAGTEADELSDPDPESDEALDALPLLPRQTRRARRRTPTYH